MVRDPLVLGADIGGSSSKAVLCDAAGRILGRGTAPGGSLRSSVGDPATNIGAALRDALGTLDPARVVAGMIGMAGSTAVPDRARQIAYAAWDSVGLPGRPQTGTDLDIAYTAGATGGDGVLVLAGTGSVAASFASYHLTRRCDGIGWLLGDEGSAVWLGLTAARAVSAALDGRGPQTALTESVVAALRPDEPTGDPRQDIISVVYGMPPARFGELAPLVTAAAVDGDPVAGRIVDDGCAALIRTARVVASDTTDCLVLAGSLLTTPGPVADRVRAGLTDLPTPVVASDPVAGAILAALRAGNLPVPAELPARLRANLRPPG